MFLPLLSQPYSRTLPSPDRYDKRYEQEVFEKGNPHHRPQGRGGPEDAEEAGITTSPRESCRVRESLMYNAGTKHPERREGTGPSKEKIVGGAVTLVGVYLARRQ